MISHLRDSFFVVFDEVRRSLAQIHTLSAVVIMRIFFSVSTLGVILLAQNPCSHAFAQNGETERCREAASQAERTYHIPDGFLYAISRVESGKKDGDGRLTAWPWTIMANGTGHYYTTRSDAINAAAEFRQQGITSIDVGCMQINLQQHPEAFSSLDQAFDPVSNALFAGHFLVQLHDKTGSWPRAAAAYHSQTPGLGTPYQWKVLETWAIPQDEVITPRASTKHPGRATQGNSEEEPSSNTLAAAEESPSAPVIRNFHPFTGFSHITQPLAHHSGMTGMKGRGLASYRSMPTPLARPTG
ncbi:transglycosylase SLT domain-containing protein [Asaia prunellae]|uniref:transglycosylase SLT domain-containing protein n=1 Tax=Asaia prunellae TaxID=610245 RepID=UPI00046E5E4C|nr:transglycosylase SLT domain-containing protein [Asaia prunellae]